MAKATQERDPSAAMPEEAKEREAPYVTEAGTEARGVGRSRLKGRSLSGDLERAFVEAWHRHWPQAREMLTHLTSVRASDPKEADYHATFDLQAGMKRALGQITERDVRLAETIIQWLGSGVGFGFIEEALSRAGYKIVKTEERKSKERRERIEREVASMAEEGQIRGIQAVALATRIHRAGIDEGEGSPFGLMILRCSECQHERPAASKEDLAPKSISGCEECGARMSREDGVIDPAWVEVVSAGYEG